MTRARATTSPAVAIAASVLIGSVVVSAYLIWAPPSTDLAAQTFRAELFAERGFTIWSEDWYGGFHVLGYSVLYPPLAALAGVRVAGALAALAAAAAFAWLAHRRFGSGALLGSAWFAAGVCAWLFTGRLTFLLGVAIGLAALLAADTRRTALAGALAALTALASPVAGVFVGLAGVAVGLAGGPGSRTIGAALALPAAVVVGILGLGFPTSGEAPFAFSSFVAVPLFAAGAMVLIPPRQRALRIGVGLYALLALASFAIPNPLGGNAVRLAALFAGPVAALVLWSRPLALLVVAAPLLYWQLDGPVRDAAAGAGDPSTERAFHAPLVAELDRLESGSGGPRPRVHVPPTENRFEAVHVARRYPLARGWLRQLESDDFDLFDDGELTRAAYRDWLRRHAVAYVAVPDAKLDYLARDEVALIDSGLSFLRPEWESEDWRLFSVRPEPRLAVSEDDAPRPRISRPGPGRIAVAAGPGRYLLRVSWTRYWRLEGARACAERDGEWTRLELLERGEVELGPRLSLAALPGRDRVCSE